MKVIHVIPSAFNYFDDIRAEAFALIEYLELMGIDNEAFTIEFGGSVPETTRTEVKATAPSQQFKGLVPTKEMIALFASGDIVHVHCPLLGGARKILRWKKAGAPQPLVVSYHRRVIVPDFFSLLTSAYNAWYLPKLWRLATVGVVLGEAGLPSKLARQHDRVVRIDDSEEFLGEELVIGPDGRRLTRQERLAIKHAIVYNQVVSSS